MGITNYLGLFALLSLPIIVLLYMFRPKHKLLDVPSIFLWQEIMDDLSKAKKLEKFKKTILFLLDILIVVLITLLLLGIFFHTSKTQKHHIVMINSSFSMNSEDVKPSRFEHAKKMAAEYIEKLDHGDEVTLITVNSKPKILYKRETDKTQLLNAVKNQKISYDNPKLSNLGDLISEAGGSEETKVLYFTDQPYKFAENIIVKESDQNFAIKSMSAKVRDGKIDVAITVENQSSKAEKVQVSLYDNDLYLDTKSVEVDAEATEVIFFENLNAELSVLKASIDNKDINPFDNLFYELTNSGKQKKIALISHGHFFLEKFLSLSKNFEVFLIKPEDYKNLYGYDAYIFDKFLPDELPKDGNILLLDPDENKKNPFAAASGYIENPIFDVEKHEISQFMDKQNFLISISQTFDKTRDRKAIYSAGDKLLAFSTMTGPQKIVVFGFDFRYTDLPLKADFPILMNNLTEYLLDQLMTEKAKYNADESIKVFIKPSSNSVKVITPSGKQIKLETDSSVKNFNAISELGLYTVEQESSPNQETVLSKSYFAINPPDFVDDTEYEWIDKNANITGFTSRSDIDKILIIALLLALLLELLLRVKKNPFANKKLLAMRALAILLVILSLMDIKLSFESKYTDTIFVADYSKSMHNKDAEVNSFIQDSLKNIAEGDRYGIVSFAENAKIEKPLSEERLFNPISSDLDKGATNIEKGVEKAEFMFSKEHKKRIVLISDGRENAGDLMKKMSDLKDKKIVVDYYPLGKDNFEEVEIDEIKLPKDAKKGQDIQIEAKINANIDSNAKIYLYGRNNLLEKRDVSIKNGTNHFIFSSKLQDAGIVEYRVEIIPEKDTYFENNKLSGFVNVEGKLKMLIVQNQNFGENYAKIFDDFDVTLIDQTQVPLNMESILYYDAFILADVSLEKTNEKFIENLSQLVKNHGKSLIVSGGQNSYAMGGYYKSKLEEMLPVEMKVKDDEKKENIAMVLVIDKSGSMSSGEYGVSLIGLAKEAAVRASEVLEEKDYLGVLAFDGDPHWIVTLQNLTDKETVKKRILEINADGGTSIQPALEAAIVELEKNDAALKHIILLTDGMAESSGYEPLIERMKKAKISLSSVAVGEEADARLLKYLANHGGGRYYKSNVFTDIPTIFAKETVLAGKKYINNISFFPNVNSSATIFNGIESLPQLHGYVASTKKPLANVILSGPDNDPILATYHYGLGKTVAFTSDMHGIWSKDFLSWQNNKRLWHNILSDVLNQTLSKNFELTCEYKDNKATLRLEWNHESSIKEKQLKAVLIDSESERQEIVLKLKEPFVYEASFKPKKDGLYFLVGETETKGDAQEKNNTPSFSSAFIVPYSNEFRFFDTKIILPEDFTNTYGGRIINSAGEVFSSKVDPIEKEYKIAKLLLVLALLIFLTELCFRMTNLGSRLEKYFSVLRKNKNNKNKNNRNNKNTKNDNRNEEKKGDKKRKPHKIPASSGETNSSSHIDELLKGI